MPRIPREYYADRIRNWTRAGLPLSSIRKQLAHLGCVADEYWVSAIAATAGGSMAHPREAVEDSAEQMSKYRAELVTRQAKAAAKYQKRMELRAIRRAGLEAATAERMADHLKSYFIAGFTRALVLAERKFQASRVNRNKIRCDANLRLDIVRMYHVDQMSCHTIGRCFRISHAYVLDVLNEDAPVLKRTRAQVVMQVYKERPSWVMTPNKVQPAMAKLDDGALKPTTAIKRPPHVEFTIKVDPRRLMAGR